MATNRFRVISNSIKRSRNDDERFLDGVKERFRRAGLTFRHTDNINHWLRVVLKLGLPAIFLPETTDLYDRKNLPRVVYCIHALSLYLFRLGRQALLTRLFFLLAFHSIIRENVIIEQGAADARPVRPGNVLGRRGACHEPAAANLRLPAAAVRQNRRHPHQPAAGRRSPAPRQVAPPSLSFRVSDLREP